VNPEKLTTVTIEVTERLVKTGTVNDSADCPFARALKKVLAKDVEVDANYDDITLTLPDDVYPSVIQSIPTPATVAKFMEKIDARETDPYVVDEVPEKLPPLPKPFSINLKIKNKFLRPGLRA